jgi:uncharacterized protein YeaO (DUF488 family)
MATRDSRRTIELLAALSHQAHCHRSVLRELLIECGATVR